MSAGHQDDCVSPSVLTWINGSTLQHCLPVWERDLTAVRWKEHASCQSWSLATERLPLALGALQPLWI
jgi:hypothetical protein